MHSVLKSWKMVRSDHEKKVNNLFLGVIFVANDIEKIQPKQIKDFVLECQCRRLFTTAIFFINAPKKV